MTDDRPYIRVSFCVFMWVSVCGCVGVCVCEHRLITLHTARAGKLLHNECERWWQTRGGVRDRAYCSSWPGGHEQRNDHELHSRVRCDDWAGAHQGQVEAAGRVCRRRIRNQLQGTMRIRGENVGSELAERESHVRFHLSTMDNNFTSQKLCL